MITSNFELPTAPKRYGANPAFNDSKMSQTRCPATGAHGRAKPKSTTTTGRPLRNVARMFLCTNLILFVACVPQPVSINLGFVCWEILLPSDNAGNLAAVIVGTPPEDMYALAPAEVPSNGTLKLFGIHDGLGNIRFLEGFEYTDPDAWRVRVALGDPRSDRLTQLEGRTILAEVPGLLLQFTAGPDQLSAVAYVDASGVTEQLAQQADTMNLCSEFVAGLMNGPPTDSLASNLCFVHAAMQCISGLAKSTGAPGWGVYGPKRNMAGTATRFADLACQQVSSVPRQHGAVESVDEDIVSSMDVEDLVIQAGEARGG